MKRLKTAKTLYIICSVLLCVLGLCMIIWPSLSARTLCAVIGILLMIAGASKIVGYFSHDNYFLAFQFDLALGILTAAVGMIMAVHPGPIVSFIPFVIGLFMLIDGVFKLQTSFDARRFGLDKWWSMLTLAIICCVLGAAIMLNSSASGNAIMILMGISLLFDGIQNLVDVLYTVRLMKDGEDHNTIYDTDVNKGSWKNK